MKLLMMKLMRGGEEWDEAHISTYTYRMDGWMYWPSLHTHMVCIPPWSGWMTAQELEGRLRITTAS